jgi:hypothetical protein
MLGVRGEIWPKHGQLSSRDMSSDLQVPRSRPQRVSSGLRSDWASLMSMTVLLSRGLCAFVTASACGPYRVFAGEPMHAMKSRTSP